jgi:hypothetical protein
MEPEWASEGLVLAPVYRDELVPIEDPGVWEMNEAGAEPEARDAARGLRCERMELKEPSSDCVTSRG